MSPTAPTVTCARTSVWDHGYLGLGWLRAFASAVLAILLWWLIPLGVNLHIHG
jgi:hypothetical protein